MLACFNTFGGHMRINDDFSRRAVVSPRQHDWVASPQAGVERVMLDRIGAEKARATSLVRYAPNSYFPSHLHPGGEEILVLEGTFVGDEHHYPAGWYLRSPPGSSHQPSSPDGALIFVKLRQMSPLEQHSVRIDIRDPTRWAERDGGTSCPLFAGFEEMVSIERRRAETRAFESRVGGIELLILEGSLHEGDHTYECGTWIRLPPGDCPVMSSGRDGVTFYLKTGHLTDVSVDGVA